ncbi:MAG: Chemotaxis response regulator protein-glutamate methylesterase [Syntrophorhabdaceae bacterium PtaU1.Bin034]|jgi:two-component system chemotaxis response regulator CheB|nr:MAG: Chemotaxis response regulator protein-glutamate methylesterase [Syntrophorhabdaceae bacterium PtaU1.Bin034]
MIKVLVVDDSRVMTKLLSRILERDAAIEVVGTAGDGAQALEKIEALKPDVVTMDIEMPVMNGIETLKQIMATNPIPVIMLSTLTRDHADITMEALALGACDFVTKDFSNSLLADKEQELISKIKDVARNRVKLLLRGLVSHQERPVSLSPAKASGRKGIVCIGASTGGPPALQYILSHLPGNFPVPIVIAQHMPRLFTQSFAERLNKVSELTVKEAEEKEILEPGVALVAPGDTHIALKRKGRQVAVEFYLNGQYVYRPSVDLLMSSTASAYEPNSMVGTILTGMGSDGVVGMKELKSKGGYVIAQNEETCVVYGMPKAVVNARLADAVLPIGRIPEEIMKIL